MRLIFPIILLLFTAVCAFGQEVVINEINYHSANNFDTGDWVEFHNYGIDDISISGWVFKDANDTNLFVFPGFTTLEAEGYIVLCHDIALFTSLFPEVTNFTGNFGFNVSNGGELIRLYDNGGNLVDSLTFDDEAPWPMEPDGAGPTLELLDPLLPNHLAENWRVSLLPHGSPGAQNSVTSVERYDNPLIIDGFVLHAPFPNPFNPVTKICFDIPYKSFVTLEIYDVQGRLAAELAGGYHQVGRYEADFEAGLLPSGVYFARLAAGEYQSVQKLLLMK